MPEKLKYIFKALSPHDFDLAKIFAKFSSIIEKYLTYKITVIITVIFVCIVALFLKKCVVRKPIKKSMGKKSVEEINDLRNIIEEIHYAAYCHCSRNEAMVTRCIDLLDKYPEACNISLRSHNYTPFLRACWNGCTDLICHMIHLGANIDATTDAGEGALYLAAYNATKNKNQDFSALQVLLDAGVPINQRRKDGFTALHLAASRGHTRLVKWLLSNGAYPDTKGITPAQLARLNDTYMSEGSDEELVDRAYPTTRSSMAATSSPSTDLLKQHHS